MSANVPAHVSPVSVGFGPAGINERLCLHPCSGQLRYRRSASAVFYCYLLIGGIVEPFHTKDEGQVLPAFSLLRIEWDRI